MLKFLFLTFSMVFVFGISQTNAQVNDLDISQLSKKGQDSYNKLLKAEVFESAIAGEGMFSEKVSAFDILLNEKNADVAFSSLLENAKVAGKLYALSGMYFTDYPQFLVEVEKYKVSKVLVMTQSGCKMFEQETANIIESKIAPPAIIPPSKTFADFLETKPQSWNLDIANGGYPASFKYFAKKEKARIKSLPNRK